MPTDTNPQMGTITLVAAAGDALCAPLPTPLAVTGTGQNGGVTLSTQTLNFGNVSCGTTAPPQMVTLTNSGNAPLMWSAMLGASPSPFALSNPTFGSLSPGAMATITVTPAAIPATASVATNAFGDTLTITTNVVGANPFPIQLQQTASGAIMAFNPTAVAFGNVPVTTSSMGSFQLVNNGNAPSHITLMSSNAAFTVPAGATLVAGGASPSVTGTFSPGNSTTAQMANVTMMAAGGDVLCAPLPSALRMTGTGTNGSVGISPASLNFGNTNCGTTAVPQMITVSNPGNQAYTITPTLGGGASSPFSITLNPPSGVVAPNGGMVVITVTPHAIPAVSAVPGNYGDILTIATTVAMDTPHQIQLTQNAYGAILGLSTQTLAFPGTTVGQQSSSQFAVTNTGNAPAPISFMVAGSSVFTFDPMQTVPGSTTNTPSGYFTPTLPQMYSATASLVLQAGTPTCGPLPGTINLSGMGVAGTTATVTPGNLNFGRVNCGSTAAAQTVTIRNTGVSAFNYTAALMSGTHYMLSSASGMVPAMSSVMLTVTPRAIGTSAVDTSFDAFADTLTVTTTAMSDMPHTIALHETAQGAVLSFVPLGVTVNRSNNTSANFRVDNAGNVVAPVTVMLNNPNPGSVLLQLATNNGNSSVGAPFSDTVTDTGNVLLGGTGSATVSVMTTAPLCATLPAPLNITAQ